MLMSGHSKLHLGAALGKADGVSGSLPPAEVAFGSASYWSCNSTSSIYGSKASNHSWMSLELLADATLLAPAQRVFPDLCAYAFASASVSESLLVLHRASISQDRLRTAGSGFHYC